MRALVTGGRGFVGHHLVHHLLECGDQVVAIDIEHDVADVAAMAAVVLEHLPDVIYHLAAISHVGQSWDDPTAVLRVNVLGTAAILAAARQMLSPPLMLFVSSAEVYGIVTPDELPLTEMSESRPASPYAASKLAAEAVVLQAGRGYGQRVIVARPFNHFGPGQSPTFFVPALASRLVAAQRESKSSVAVGNLGARRDFTDVRDVVRAYRMLVEHGECGEIYNIASGVDRSMQEVADTLRDLVDPRIHFEIDPSLLRPADVPVLRGDATKMTTATGWSPLITFDATISDVLNSVRSVESN